MNLLSAFLGPFEIGVIVFISLVIIAFFAILIYNIFK